MGESRSGNWLMENAGGCEDFGKTLMKYFVYLKHAACRPAAFCHAEFRFGEHLQILCSQ
jgi:hypothetical protein